MKQKFFKALAVYLALNLIFEIVSPSVAFALTGGPSQPEVESFEPIGTTEMVDPFSGDFNYNLPLMNVPGPNGGYPINLAYHAGIGMDQEASWVGLGWNINPGVINRTVRGIPDDFLGDKITKQISMKSNNTFGLGVQLPISNFEVLGFKSGSFSYQLYYNNYKGVGQLIGLNLSSLEQGHCSPGFATSLKLTADSKGGVGVDPSMSYTKISKDNEKMNGYHLGVGFHSREGLTDVTFSHERHKVAKDGLTKNKKKTNYKMAQPKEDLKAQGAGGSFCFGSYIPHVEYAQTGFNARLSFELGTAPPMCKFPTGVPIYGTVSMLDPVTDAIDHSAYGYLYLADRDYNSTNGGADAMMDFNREKDVAPSKHTPNMAVPVLTNDVYSVKGQGIGGVFRAYRSDIGTLSDPTVSYDIGGGSLALELALATPDLHLGIDMGINYSTSYSGTWKGDDYSLLDVYKFNGVDPAVNSLLEPVYFKALGEQTKSMNPLKSAAFYGEQPVRFDMDLAFSGVSMKPRANNTLVVANGTTGYTATNASTLNANREKRNQSMEYLSNDELSRLQNSTTLAHEYPFGAMSLYNENNTSSTSPNPTPLSTAYDYTHTSDPAFTSKSNSRSHIGQITTVNPDGNRYVYGLPAYNKLQKEVSFSVSPGNSLSPVTNVNEILYNGGDNSTANQNGSSQFFESSTTPPYTHAYLLTSIISPDYVDLTNNGPSEDDFGSYVKFNYSSLPYDLEWRVPFNTYEANFGQGRISDPNDDKASYTYGKKDIYFANSIETKTHIAVFILNDDTKEPRQDACGVDGEDNAGGNWKSKRQRYLKQIKLYSKADLAKNGASAIPIKTVNLEYNYALCGSVENNAGGTVLDANNINLNANHGKLTLQKVWFSYLGNTTGQLSPYVFNYNESNTATDGDNPNFKKSQVDRWGNYKPDDASQSCYNVNNPYCDQRTWNKTAIDMHAAAWSLKSVALPSGGQLTVSYESDDYGYVQDQNAMQMCRIIGTATDPNFSNVSGIKGPDGSITYGGSGLGTSLDGAHTYIYFAMDNQINKNTTSVSDLQKQYMSGVDDLYFKVFERLKRYFPGTNVPLVYGQIAYDYVEGYAKLDPGIFNAIDTDNDGNYDLACVKVKMADYALGALHANPFRLAGWQYLKMQRPDLFTSGNSTQANTLSFITAAITVIAGSAQILSGFYNYCNMMNFCSDMSTPSQQGPYYRPSFVRLNSPTRMKYGGGHRVKQITISDQWATMAVNEKTMIYGQKYSYNLPDGTSSGVAEYEPLIGGEEIPQHLPDRYSSDSFFGNDDALFLVKPYGESYFPSPNIGYSRVTVQNIDQTPQGQAPQGVTNTKEGITVSEFYTAKDFPTVVDNTDMKHKKYKFPVLVPFLGMFSFNNQGYSEGYKVELNDMHGKPKSVATYSSNANLADPLAPAVTKVEYVYNTTAQYNPNSANHLSSQVTVLDGNAATSIAEIGKNIEFFVDKREDSNITSALSIQSNLDLVAPFAFTFTAIPNFEWSEAMFRSIVTNKIVTKNGILMQTRATDQGSTVVTNNLMFDSETGTPLLTTVTNDFNNPVYTYKYAAPWAYDNMGGSYKNLRAQVILTNMSSGVGTLAGAANYLTRGDELVEPGSLTLQRYWVNSITNGSSVELIDEAGVHPAFTGTKAMYVIRSGRRNLQSTQNGVIVSLNDPTGFLTLPHTSVGGGAAAFCAAWNVAYFSPNSDGGFDDLIWTDPCSGGVYSSGKSLFPNLQFYPNGGGSFTVDLGPPGIPGVPYVDCSITITFPVGVIVNDDLFMNNTLSINGSTVTVSSGSTVIATGSLTGGSCFSTCNASVLHATASRFTDNWNMNYADAGNPSANYLNGATANVGTAVAGTGNPYRLGALGIWRRESDYAYQVDRIRRNPTNVAIDGMYNNFVPYDWTKVQANNALWTMASRVSQYSPYGFELEDKDTLGIYSSSLYGYSNSLPTAILHNSRYMEMAYDGFEDYPSTVYPAVVPNNQTHIQFATVDPSKQLSLSSTSHTGKHGLNVQKGGDAVYSAIIPAFYVQNVTNFSAQQNQDYNLSVWVYNPSSVGREKGYGDVSILSTPFFGSPTLIASYVTSANDIIVEGWHKIDLKFNAQGGASVITIKLSSLDPNNGAVVFDDLRIQPFLSSMTSYVYNPITLWQIAELDDRNFATFYNYDEQGALVQVKKETAKGVMTIKSSRNNTHH